MRPGRALAQSLLLHALLVGALIGWDYWRNYGRETFGDPNPLGGAAGVTAVATIPLPRRAGRPNPVANDTETQLPTPPKPEPKRPQTKAPDPKAIPIKGPEPKKSPAPAANQRYKPDPVLPNQVTSTLGQAAVSEMFAVRGSGGVGSADSSPFGQRFGWYEKLLRERIAQKWTTADVPAQYRTAPVAIVGFTIARDGSVSDVRILQSSGIYPLDNSAQRAIFEAAPLPPLPPQFERSVARVELHFELKR
jgi:protein TonB